MLKFLKVQWKLGKIDENYLDKLIELDRLTVEEKELIIK